MKKLRLISLILLCALLALSLTACFAHIEDTNGDDDFSLVTITDEDLTQSKSTSYLQTGAIHTTKGNRTEMKINKFSGINVLEKFTVAGVSMTVEVTMSVTSGNCRLVLVCDEEIVHDFDINGTESYVADTAGTYYLKLAGESAKLSLEYTVSR